MAYPKSDSPSRWVFLRDVERRGKNQYSLFRCQCGIEKVIFKANVVLGRSRSCGCLMRDHQVVMDKGELRTYQIWQGMVSRCERPQDKNYPRYGGRGIRVCDQWKAFRNFIGDMGPAPDRLTIERIDNEKHYEPGNCRWATMIDQQNNRRDNHRLAYRGETLTLSQWARRLGMRAGTLSQRIYSGWSIEAALSTPVQHP